MRTFVVPNSVKIKYLVSVASVFPCARTMYLRYFLNENGDRQYTLAVIDPSGKPTLSAHPARFSPEDKYSRQRITIKKRFGLLITQQPEPIH